MATVTVIVAPERIVMERFTLRGETFHHVFNVRRLSVGDVLRLVDGRGLARWGRVAEIGRREASIELGELAPTNESAASVELWVAPPRPKRATWLVEKATEVGVDAVRWLSTERSRWEVTATRLERLTRVAASALEQCHRSRLPELSGPHAWQEIGQRLDTVEAAWFLEPKAPLVRPTAGVLPVALLVGPEGGWTRAERRGLLAAGVHPVGLGPRALRVETAAIVSAALWLTSIRE